VGEGDTVIKDAVTSRNMLLGALSGGGGAEIGAQEEWRRLCDTV